ncbi:MAG: M56 family metallopeptidase, partial [Oxalobacteraceae bacterium]
MLDIVGEAALRVVLLTALVQCIVWVLRLRSARLLLSAWTVVLVASIAMPMLPHISPVRLPIDSAVSGAVADSVVELLQQSTLDRWATLPDDTVTRHDAPPPFRSWLSAIYVIVGGGILLRTMLGVGLSLRLLARASRVHPMWAAGHRVKISTDVTGPVTIAQVIVLPVDAMEWSAEMQQAVLAHEQAHVARVDFAMLVVSQLNRALFWFNPLSWWLHRRLVTLSELASDDQAIATIKDRFRYAEILLEMGRRSSATPRGPAMARPSTLAYRIERIVQGRTKLSRISRPWQILLTAGVAGLSLAVSSLASSFTSNPVTTPSSMELTEALEGLHTSNWGTGATDEPGERDGSLPVGHVPIDLSAERSPIPSAPTAKTFTQISASTKPWVGLDRRRVKAVVALSPT